MDRVKYRTVTPDFSDIEGYRLDDRFGKLAMELRPVLQAIAYKLVHDQNAAEDIA